MESDDIQTMWEVTLKKSETLADNTERLLPISLQATLVLASADQGYCFQFAIIIMCKLE